MKPANDNGLAHAHNACLDEFVQLQTYLWLLHVLLRCPRVLLQILQHLPHDWVCHDVLNLWVAHSSGSSLCQLLLRSIPRNELQATSHRSA